MDSLPKDKPLFTPGPLTTSLSVKQAMLRDLGSRDTEFIGAVRELRDELLRVGGVSQQGGYEAILMQGSGTFSVEAVIASAMPPAGKLLCVVNGAYGDRIVKIAQVHGIETVVQKYRENELPSVEAVDEALAADPEIKMVVTVHCETTSGIINPIEAIGAQVAKHGRCYFVDSMSAFGAVPLDFEAAKIDFLVSSANKCIEGVPGFGFCICRREALFETRGWSRTLSLDLLAQWEGLEKNGQFRFTPPTHTILAFRQALRELEEEGGVAGRAARYEENYRTLVAGMRSLGFVEYVDPELQGYIITSFRYPEDPNFQFEKFYDLLNEAGFVIYPGKVSDADCFRIGNIGRIDKGNVEALLEAIKDALAKMQVSQVGAMNAGA
ncbi:MAG: 2-aminoethylphosphonate--pyruvate transaminase [Planctomycetota bacterium]|nr:2-aminoethylphosphonate--pyruvate transaminase [Planctomycetota bacterium]